MLIAVQSSSDFVPKFTGIANGNFLIFIDPCAMPPKTKDPLLFFSLNENFENWFFALLVNTKVGLVSNFSIFCYSKSVTIQYTNIV